MFCSTKIRKSPVPIKFFLVFSPVPRSMRLLAKKHHGGQPIGRLRSMMFIIDSLCQVVGSLDDILRGDTLVVLDALDGLCEHVGDAELFDLGAMAGVEDGVGEDHFLQFALLDALAGGARHDAVAGDGAYAEGALLLHDFCGEGDRSGGVDHIVDEHYILALDVTDDLHGGYDIGTLTHLVAQDEGALQIFGVGIGALGPSDVGGGDAEVGQVEALDIGQEGRGGVEVVYGDIEEGLLLVGVEVHRDETVDSGDAEQVGFQLGGDGDTGLVFAVLTGPAVVGDDGDDVVGGGALGCINHQQKLHEVVGAGIGRLYEKNVMAANGLFEAYGEFAVSKACKRQLAHGDAQVFADFLCQVEAVGARENHKLRIVAHF